MNRWTPAMIFAGLWTTIRSDNDTLTESGRFRSGPEAAAAADLANAERAVVDARARLALASERTDERQRARGEGR